jgi:serine/threonine protein kinase/tetratricopeptide (TPR) repeat protein
MTPLEVRARSIFLSALEYEGQEADEFVNGACGPNTELRARVEELLKAHRQLGDIDNRPAQSPSPLPGELALESPGTHIGPYRLLEQIGEGGFGIVYMAEQTQPVRRKVALKIIKPGMDTRMVVARFEAERQALALMDHPNIARVFDGGATETGRPYFVMELVRGVPITDFCDQSVLSVKERVELFIAVCQAVQHAHQKGIIHRDLKPSNVLVTMHDDRRVVKVIDFGVSKAIGQQLTEKTLFTNFAQMIGTPLYMSPEQAQMSGLDVDTRSDIYALGVLLYELLTGTTPFDRERLKTVAFDEVRRIIREEQPPRPSTRLSSTDAATTMASHQRGSDPRRLRQILRGELDWIVMKCLEKNRNRRYETANGLAADLARYLNKEPVQACPPSVAYRLRVFSRRYRAVIGTAGLLLAIALFGGALTIAQSFRTARAEAAAVRAQLAESETHETSETERASAMARDLETLSQANSLIESGRNHLDFSEWARAEADLNRALSLRREHSSAWLARGEVYARLNLWDLAAADFQRVDQLQGSESARSLYLHALLRLRVRDEAGYRKACERMVQKFDDPRDPRAWEKEEVARACLLVPNSALGADRLVRLTLRAVDSGKSVSRLASLATALYRAGQYDVALDQAQEARRSASGTDTTWIDSVEAMIRHRRGEPELARRALQAAANSRGVRLRSRSDHWGASPNPLWWEEAQGDLYFREATILIDGKEPAGDLLEWIAQGIALQTLGRNDESISSYNRAIELKPDHAGVLNLRASLNYGKGDWPANLSDLERLRQLKPADASAANNLAWCLATCPDPKYRDYRRALALAELAVKLAPDQPSFWTTLGVVRYRAADWAGSVTTMLRSMKFTNRRSALDWYILAVAQWRLTEKARARVLLSYAESLFSAEATRNAPLLALRDEARELIGIADTAVGPGDPARRLATSAYTALLEIAPGLPWVLQGRGSAYQELKQWSQAAADFARVTGVEPRNFDCWYAEAACRLAAGDLAGYRKARTGIIANFRNVRHQGIVGHVCQISAAAPASPDEAQALLEMAKVAVTAQPQLPRLRGALNYRAANYEAAIADLNKSASVYPRRAWDWLFLAMAQYKLGQADLAKQSLGRAVDWIERADRNQGIGWESLWTTWYEPLEVEQILKEASELIHPVP